MALFEIFLRCARTARPSGARRFPLLLALSAVFYGSEAAAQFPRPPRPANLVPSHVPDSLFYAGFAIEMDRPYAAIKLYHQAVAQARSVRDSVTLANAIYRIGITYWSEHVLDSARKYLDSALVYERPLGDPVALARVYNGIGATYYQLGIYEPALEAFLQALPLRRASTDSAGLARTLTNIGKVYHDWGQYSRAHSALTEAAEVARHARDGAAALGYALNSLAMLQIDRGELADARKLMQQSIDAYNMPGGLYSAADSIASWEYNATSEGVLLLREGHWQEARVILMAVLKSTTDRKSDIGRAKALLYLGEANAKLSNVAVARSQFEEALALARAGEQRIVALEALNHLANLEYEAGNATASLRSLRAYTALRDTIFDQDAALRIAAREARAETDAALQANQLLRTQSAQQAIVISRQRIVVALSAVIATLVSALLILVARFQRRDRERVGQLTVANSELETVNKQLKTALAEVRTLSGLIPICSNCKKVRDDQGYWNAVESFISEHSNATFSHSICQECGPKLYGELWYDNSDDNSDDSSHDNSK